MARTKETSTKQWVQEGPYPPPSDDEDNAIQDDISLQVRWNTLVPLHRATRHKLQNIENEMWEIQYLQQEMLTGGPSAHRPQSPNDENKSIQDDISLQVRWNILVEHHCATRHKLQNIENEMWEFQYRQQEMLKEGPSAHRPQSPNPEYSTADASAIRERMRKLEKEAKRLRILDKGKAELKDVDSETEEDKRRREQREAQNIWARFDRHSLPRHK